MQSVHLLARYFWLPYIETRYILVSVLRSFFSHLLFTLNVWLWFGLIWFFFSFSTLSRFSVRSHVHNPMNEHVYTYIPFRWLCNYWCILCARDIVYILQLQNQAITFCCFDFIHKLFFFFHFVDIEVKWKHTLMFYFTFIFILPHRFILHFALISVEFHNYYNCFKWPKLLLQQITVKYR